MLPGRGKQEINLKVHFLHLLTFISLGNDMGFLQSNSMFIQKKPVDAVNRLIITHMHKDAHIHKNEKKRKKKIMSKLTGT